MKLQCLGGQEAPPSLASDLSTFARLPERAQQSFWDALAPSLDEPIASDVEARLDAFVAEHRCDGDLLARALKAARFLVRELAANGGASEALGNDLRALLGDEGEALMRVLRAGLAPALRHLRATAAARAIDREGQRVVAVRWSVHTVVDTDDAAALNAQYGTLAFTVDDHGTERMLTLHLTAEHVSTLGRFVAKFR